MKTRSRSIQWLKKSAIISSDAATQSRPASYRLRDLVPKLRQVSFQSANLFLAADRAMARHDRLYIKSKNVVAGVNPVSHRPGPHNRVPADEHYIARKDRFVFWHVNQNVAPRMCRADIGEFDPFVSDV